MKATKILQKVNFKRDTQDRITNLVRIGIFTRVGKCYKSARKKGLFRVDEIILDIICYALKEIIQHSNVASNSLIYRSMYSIDTSPTVHEFC